MNATRFFVQQYPTRRILSQLNGLRHPNNIFNSRSKIAVKAFSSSPSSRASASAGSGANEIQMVKNYSMNGFDLIDTTIVGDTSSNIAEAASVIDKISAIGDLHSLGLACYYTPVGWFQSGLEIVYLTTGLPWWASIMVGSALVRLTLFPVAVKAQRASIDLQNVKPLTDKHKDRALILKERGDLQGAMRENQKVMQVFRDHNINPLAAFWGVTQIPIFISCFLGVKNMAELPVPGFSTGGIAWIPDLTAADPYLILPVLSSVSMLLSFEANKEAAANISPGMKQGLRSMAIFGLVVFMYFPSGLMVYTLTNGILQLIQVLFLRIPAVRKYFKLELKGPPVPQQGILATRPLSLMEARKLLHNK